MIKTEASMKIDFVRWTNLQCKRLQKQLKHMQVDVYLETCTVTYIAIRSTTGVSSRAIYEHHFDQKNQRWKHERSRNPSIRVDKS